MHLPFGVWVMDRGPSRSPRATSPQRPARPLKLSGAESSFLVGAVLALAIVVRVLVVLCVRNCKSDKEPVRESHSTVDAEGVRHSLVEAMDA